MRSTLNSLAGAVLIIAAVAGLVLGIGGIIGMAAFHARVEAGVVGQFALLDRALTATEAGLQTASASLADSRATLASIRETVGGSVTAVEDIVPAVDAMSGVVGTELPATLGGATRSLTVFADTAAVIDQVMGLLSAIPLVNLPAYNPEVPLSQSVIQLRDSVGDLEGKLKDMQSNLDETATNLRDIRGDVAGVGEALDGLSKSLEGTDEVLASYQAIIADVRAEVEAGRAGAGRALRLVRIFATALLLWVTVASFGLLLQGLDRLTRGRVRRATA